jgi:hypothetical protein
MIVKHLLERRWIECQGTGRDMSFRITEEGLAAKKAPIPDGRKSAAIRIAERISQA